MPHRSDKIVNIKDVAREANVSISTVSNVIHGTKYVSDELKKRVRKIISDLDYEVNPVASSLKSKTTNSIGIVIPNINRIFFPQVIKGIQSYCARFGYNITFCDTDDSLEKEQYFIKMLKGSWVDGIILDSVASDDDFKYMDFLANLKSPKKKIAVVSLERNFGDRPMDSVVVNNYQGARTATKHLIDCGCRKIAHITGPAYACMVQARLKGYQEEIAEHADHFRSLIVNGDFSPLSGYLKTQELISQHRDVDGIFAANDQMAIGAIKALREHKISIPEEVKIVGFDNTFIASIVDPPLTTINVPKLKMGVTAAQLLIERIRQDIDHSRIVEIPFNLVVRQSTQPDGDGHDQWELFGW